MISLRNVSKSFKIRYGERKHVFRNLSIDFPKKNVAILGRNGAGKSTLIRLLSGNLQLDEGQIIRSCSISWPIGFRGSFQRELTGIENVRFVARIYGQDTDYVISYVKEFAQLGNFFYEPVKTYSSGMSARLAFGASLAINFECYLIDELMAVGDRSFKKKSSDAFKKKLAGSNIIMASHSMKSIKEYCDCAILIEEGEVTYFSDVNDAIASYKDLSER